jgi:hypothetical protein
MPVDRDELFARLDQLSPREIEAQLPSWDKEELVLIQEYLEQRRTKAPESDQTMRGENVIGKVMTERTIAAALIALGLVLAALILRGGYEVAASGVGAYVVNRFTGAIWQCLDTCARIETFSPDKKKK